MDNPPFSVFARVLAYVVFILASPIATFFTTKFILFEGLLGLSNVTSSVWSAIMAVVMLHIAVGLYIYRAYFETETVKSKPVKVD